MAYYKSGSYWYRQHKHQVRSWWTRSTKKVNTNACQWVDNSNIWIHVYAGCDITLKRLHRRRGKIAKSDAHNLWDRLKDYEASVLLFAPHGHVSITNSRTERDLHMAKVKHKVSGCFRNSDYAHANCWIASYLQTMANKGLNPLIATQMVLTGE